MKKRRLIIIAAILAAILALTAVSVPLIRKNKAVRIAKSLPPYILEAVLAYNDLISPGEVTLSMFEEITSLRFMYDKAVIVSVNGSKFGTNLGPYILPSRMERLYLAHIPEGTQTNLFQAFYVPSEEALLTDKELVRRWVDQVFTEAKACPMYIFDPSASEREKEIIMGCIAAYVFTESEIMTDRTLDLSALSVLPNLESVEYFIDTDHVRQIGGEEAFRETCGLTFENCPVEIIVTEDVLFDRKLYNDIWDEYY